MVTLSNTGDIITPSSSNVAPVIEGSSSIGEKLFLSTTLKRFLTWSGYKDGLHGELVLFFPSYAGLIAHVDLGKFSDSCMMVSPTLHPVEALEQRATPDLST